MRILKILTLSSVAGVLALVTHAEAQALTATGPTVQVTATAGATPTCTITAGTAPTNLNLTSLTNTTVTLAAATGAAGNVLLNCSGNSASMTITATSGSASATPVLTSVTGGNGYTIPYEFWSGTSAAAPSVKLTASASGVFTFSPVTVTAGTQTTLSYFVNVAAASKLTAVGTASTTSVPYQTTLKDSLVFAATYQ